MRQQSPTDAASTPLWVVRLQASLDALVVAFAAWTLLCWSFAFLGGSFEWLARLLPLAVALGVWLSRGLPRDATPPAVAEFLEPRRLALAAAAVLAILAAYRWIAGVLGYWLLGVAFLAATLRWERQPRGASIDDPGRPSALFLLLLCLLASAATLVLHRSDPDDGFYLSIAVTAVERPAEAILSRDGMYGEPNLPLYQPEHRLKTYEPLVAAFSYWTGLGVKDLYYLWFPAVCGALVVLVHWLAFYRLGGAYAGVGAAFALVALLAWGDGHRTIGNFGFVRLYQGKAILVSVCIPAAVLYAFRFAERVSWRNCALMLALGLSAIGVSASGIVVIPPALLAVLLGCALAGGEGRPWLGMIAVTVLMGAALVMVGVDTDQGLISSLGRFRSFPRSTDDALALVMGNSGRGLFALGAVLLAPVIAPAPARSRLVAFALVLVAVILSPFVAGYLHEVHPRFAWRIFWSVPFAFFLGLLAQRLAALRLPGLLGARLAVLAPIGLAAAYLMWPGRTTWSEANHTAIDLPRWKVPPEHGVAEAVVEITHPSQLVLAPWPVSTWFPTFFRHPRLVGVRSDYWGSIVRGDRQTLLPRQELMESISDPTARRPFSRRRFEDLLDVLRVDVVVFDDAGNEERGFAAILESRGGRLLLRRDGHQAWSSGTAQRRAPEASTGSAKSP